MLNIQYKEVIKMTNNELNKAVETYREYKAIIEEAEKIKKEAEQVIINYLNSENTDSVITDNAKITYKDRTRATLDKSALTEALGTEILEEYTKSTTYKVLTIQ